jgi:hypothetical protein
MNPAMAVQSGKELITYRPWYDHYDNKRVTRALEEAVALACSIARVKEHRRGRRRAAEREIVAHVNPTSSRLQLQVNLVRPLPHGGVLTGSISAGRLCNATPISAPPTLDGFLTVRAGVLKAARAFRCRSLREVVRSRHRRGVSERRWRRRNGPKRSESCIRRTGSNSPNQFLKLSSGRLPPRAPAASSRHASPRWPRAKALDCLGAGSH